MPSLEKPATQGPAAAPVAQPRNNAARIDPATLPAPGERAVTIGANLTGVAPSPTPLACLHCQLIGKRRLTCSKADACAELPMSFAVGPLLLAAWFVIAVAFIIAML